MTVQSAHRLLFLSHRIPYPPDKGEKIRAWHVLRHLSRSWRIHLGCFVDDPADWAYLAHLRSICAEVACFYLDKKRQRFRALSGLRHGRPLTLSYFHDPRLQHWVDATLARGDIDRGFIFCSSMAQYVMPISRPGFILDSVDIDSQKWAAYARRTWWPKRLVWAREARTLLAFERAAALSFDATLFVTGDECRRFKQLAPETSGRIGHIENGVDLERFSPYLAFPDPYPSGTRAVVFTGTMDYWPNVDAVTWFTREVMPSLRRLRPAPLFYIVGAYPAAALRKLTEQGDVVVTGRVPDTRPYLAHAKLVVAPLRIARGIQNKVLEGMAMGKVVLATPHAYEGLRAQAGRDLLVAGGVQEFAELAAEVLECRHGEVGSAARRAVEASYSWATTLRPLDSLWAD